MVEDGVFSHTIDDVAINSEILNIEGHYWFKSYGGIAEWVDWWSFSGGGSCINGATPSSLFHAPNLFVWL